MADVRLAQDQVGIEALVFELFVRLTDGVTVGLNTHSRRSSGTVGHLAAVGGLKRPQVLGIFHRGRQVVSKSWGPRQTAILGGLLIIHVHVGFAEFSTTGC